jgi:hypothetical protein
VVHYSFPLSGHYCITADSRVAPSLLPVIEEDKC